MIVGDACRVSRSRAKRVMRGEPAEGKPEREKGGSAGDGKSMVFATTYSTVTAAC
jgi:hypothetical protein